MTKVQLSELTEKDVENLMDNSTVWEKATTAIVEQESLALNDFLEALEGLGEYSICDSSSRYNCLTVKNSYRFLGSLEEACGYSAGALSDKQITKANKLVSDYITSEDDNQQERLEDAMDDLANEYAAILLSTMVAEYDAIYDTEYVKEFMQEELPSLYSEDSYYSREDNSIYHLVQD